VCNPALVIADEPTTALDVTIQAQILELLADLRERFNLSMILISHDLGVIAEVAETVAIMYAGKIVEFGTAMDVFHSPKHPYTQGLLQSVPRLGSSREKRDRLAVIEGMVPNLLHLPDGCSFAPRCFKRTGECTKGVIPLEPKDRQEVRCIHA
jgi:oligopeptide/dipeptide ABC transporter ATP-binding protein